MSVVNNHHFHPTTEPLKIDDGFTGYDKLKFKCGKFYDPYIKYVLIPENLIRDRAKQLAIDIHQHYGDRQLTLVCVLKGAFRFFNLLLEELQKVRSEFVSHEIQVDFIRVKSYSNTQSTNTVKILSPYEDYCGKDVLIVEDIVDTGKTLTSLLKLLQENRPASLKVVSMLVKRLPEVTYTPDFAGFSIPNEFVIGYGLDYNEYFRDMNNICVINGAGIEKFKSSK